MICPVCGSNVSDGLDVCPACHANLAVTRVMPKLTGTWCPSCGALVPAGSTACPKCGMPIGAPARDNARVELERRRLEERRLERERTSTLPRIESAIPSEPDPSTEGIYGRERMPHTKTFMVAALASLLVVGGVTLAITHPWDPNLTDTRATTPADTSQAGFPGTVSRLTGQDSDTDGTAVSVASADEETFNALTDAFNKLADISKRADEVEQKLDDVGISGTSSERSQGAAEAEQLAYDASNLVTTIKDIDVTTTGTYTDQRDHVATLASWLRNRVDLLRKAWDASKASKDPESDEDEILKPLSGQRSSDGGQSYAALFEKNYEAWKPQQR